MTKWRDADHPTSQTSTSRQPTEMELTLASFDCDFLHLNDIALEIGLEQDLEDFSDEEEIRCASIVSNIIWIRKSHVKCALDGTFAVIYYNLGPLTVECGFYKALHFDCEKIGTKSNSHFSSCCRDKNIKLFQSRSHQLFEDPLKKKNSSKHYYLENVRKHNNKMPFVANKDVQLHESGSYHFRIKGQFW